VKIAIASDGPDLNAEVGHKFGTSQYLIIFDIESGDFEAVPIPGASGQRGAGMQAVVLAISRDIKTALVGYCNPTVCNQLRANGIEVLTGLSGTVGEIIEKYNKGELRKRAGIESELRSRENKVNKNALAHATRSSAKQFINLLPILIGVVLLIGLFSTFVSKDFLASIFSGNMALDTLWGACFGSILAGNPINSYIIGGALLRYDISLFAITALIIAWVTVGLVQLPAEIAALGNRFALLRNGLSFILSIPIAIITVVIVNLIARGVP
jgi:predicted Fe-Mo cluster-binding NifX family protein